MGREEPAFTCFLEDEPDVRAQGHDRLEAGDARFRVPIIQPGSQLGVTTRLASPSFPYFAVEPLIFLRHVEGPEGIPLAVQVGGS